MTTVTIPKSEYETLKKRASLYETVLQSLSKRGWKIERYSNARVREFMREDKISRSAATRLKKELAER